MNYDYLFLRKDKCTIVVRFHGKALKEDAQKRDEYGQNHFQNEQTFNLFTLMVKCGRYNIKTNGRLDWTLNSGNNFK